MKKSILIFAAHPDDEALGCGGTILKYKDKGYQVFSVFFSDGVSSRSNIRKSDIKKRKDNSLAVAKKFKFKYYFEKLKDNQFDTYSLLKIVKLVEKYIDKINPEIVFTHSNKDLNIDHQIIFEAVCVAVRPQKKSNIKKVLSFEIPCSTHWNFQNNFQPNFFVDIGEYIDQKIDMVSMYGDEIRPSPHPRSLENILNISKFRGNTFSIKNAEAFEIIYDFF